MSYTIYLRSLTRHSSALRPALQLGRYGRVGKSSWSRSYSPLSGAGATSSTTKLSTLYGFILGSTITASVGYYLSTSHASSSSKQVITDLNHQYGTPEDFRKAIDELKELFGPADAVTIDPDDLHEHGNSVNDHAPNGLSHSVVVYPSCTEDAVKIVKIANKYKMPIIAYSGATALEGHTRASETGGICVNMSRMDEILEIHEEDSDVVVQPGVQWEALNETLQKKGIPLFLPLDPGPGATIGGMISTGCSGPNAVRYGTAKGEWILNITVVLPNGEVVKTRQRSRKSSAGFDTTKIFIGAEGTLGIITEATIRLAPVLKTTVAVAQFPDVQKATEAVAEMMNNGVGLQCVELCDNNWVRAVNLHGASKRQYPEQDSLFIKFQGPTPRSLKESAEIVQAISKKHGGTGFLLAKDDKEADSIWMDRKCGGYASLALLENSKMWSTDVCVPVSKLPQLVYETKQDLKESGIVSTVVGHVGDGNFHAFLMFATEEEMKRCAPVAHRIAQRAIALDGTCTGEHGVGVGKRKYLTQELGVSTVELMKTIKRAVDPYNLFNPGKLYPDASGNDAPSASSHNH